MEDEEITDDYIKRVLRAKAPSGKTLGELSSFSFCQFCLSKLSNVSAYDYDVMALTKKLNEWNHDFPMSEEAKVDIILKLRKLNLYG